MPLHFSAESTRGVASALPISVNCAGVFSTGFAGGFCCAAAAISPYVARLPEAWLSTLFDALTLPNGTFQASAAAATSIARAVAPALRICR